MLPWWNYPIIVIFGAMIFSPAWFFKKLEHILLKEEPDEKMNQSIDFLNPTLMVLNTASDSQLEKEELALQKFDKMIKSTRKRRVKNLWKLKKAEYLRHLKWKKLQEHYHGVDFVSPIVS